MALLDASKVGIGLNVIVRISLIAQDAETVGTFVQAMKALSHVVECHIMAGEFDALLRVVAENMEGYRTFQMAHLTRRNGVQNVKIDIPMQTVKISTELTL
ncbi:Lrp/AsnC family transcriptional regulator [Candidatus Sodalis endolongispinus]|uniref:Lrp/AsnC family transcriptional regulator n=1 Tax=Candidatus Sodalis endolongispinus TaxID=2812662 RepID=UPI0028A6C658|nr:Lrp/AsnC family transcriptional regulator [Candidatus Sodalis endolongispinus]